MEVRSFYMLKLLDQFPQGGDTAFLVGAKSPQVDKFACNSVLTQKGFISSRR